MTDATRAPSRGLARLARLSLIPTALVALITVIAPWRGHAYLAAILFLTMCASYTGMTLQIARRIEGEVSSRFGTRDRHAYLLERWDEANQTGMLGRLATSMGGVTATGLLTVAASFIIGFTASILVAVLVKAAGDLPTGLGVGLIALLATSIPIAGAVAIYRAASDVAVWAAEQRDMAALDSEVIQLASAVREQQGGALSLDVSGGSTGGLTEADEATRGGALEVSEADVGDDAGEVVLSFRHDEQDDEPAAQHVEATSSQRAER